MFDACFEPARLGEAVVVGERDDGGGGGAPPYVSGLAGSSIGRCAQDPEPVGQGLFERPKGAERVLGRAVVDHDDLERVGGQGLAGQGPQDVGAASRAVEGGDDDRDLRRRLRGRLCWLRLLDRAGHGGATVVRRLGGQRVAQDRGGSTRRGVWMMRSRCSASRAHFRRWIGTRTPWVRVWVTDVGSSHSKGPS